MSKETQALYRKYRPETFDDVVWQDSVVSVLREAIKNKTFSHAYLFSGSRGLGKTSIARIFAREIGTKESDLHEIDAASNRGIDDIRELREAVRSLPFESEYKVYIIDEVHMLTKEAFNALLKTLEEPPRHVIFILATTEIHKLPETIISRCEVHHFKKPAQNVLQQFVIDTAKKEGVTLESAGADLIALLGDGSFRDTLGALQKVIRARDTKKVSLDDVEKITGSPSSSLVNSVVTAIHEKDLNKGLLALGALSDGHIDINLFTKLLLQKVRFVLLLRYAKDLHGTIAEDLSPEDLELLKRYAEDTVPGINSKALYHLLTASEQLGYSSIPTLPLELALIEIIDQKHPLAN
jgi:DNA polymerase III subunit gamma/tau